MSFSQRPKLPTNHGLVCTLCHQSNIKQSGYHRSLVKTQNNREVEADVYEVTCKNCTHNHAKVAYLSSENLSEEDFQGWGSSPRGDNFLGFWHRNTNDPRGNGKFEHKRSGLKTIEIIDL